MTQKEAATEAAARYKALSKTEKEKYEMLAAKDRERYQRELQERDGIAPTSISMLRTRKPSVDVPETPTPRVESLPSQSFQNLNTEDAKTEKDINGWSPAAVRVPAQVTYEAMKDPNPYYVEEQAWRYHNPPIPPAMHEQEDDKGQHFPYVADEELRPIPPPPPVPTVFPQTPFCRWSFDEESRVLYADFRRAGGDVVVTHEDEKFLLEMYERDDITVVSEGLVSGLDKEKWSLDYVSRVAGDEYYHRFRRFDRQTQDDVTMKSKKKASVKPSFGASPEPEESDKFTAVAHAEIDKMLSMKVKDFVTYLRRRGSALAMLHHTAVTDAEKMALCNYKFVVSS